MKKNIRKIFLEANEINKKLHAEYYLSLIIKIIKLISTRVKLGGKIIFCGNGGSASDSLHLTAELIGRFKKDRKPISAISLNSEISTITAIANDFGYHKIFERQLESIGKKNDVLIALSTSGKSQNIINVLKKAKKMKIISILFTSEKFNNSRNISNIVFKVPTTDVARCQEAHIIIGHIICEALENLKNR
jgi:D-sedoheptulose 7-phosphate isomerase